LGYDIFMDHPFAALDHVQLAMPKGEEPAARRFYCDLLGMVELTKPPILSQRGGCWFASGNVQIHLGVETDFRPAKKAHPALRCVDYAALTARLEDAGVQVVPDVAIPGTVRSYIYDTFGNRIELIHE
jgi:catechol 2,3-dioxygenase-like lactoylglutathione lyase family enzyme